MLSQTSAVTRVAVKIPGGTGNMTCLNGSTFAGNTSCSNGVLNSGETAIDCGGPNCVPCDEGRTCSVANDCWSGACQGGICVALCTNGVKDGTETDVDCGGTCNDCLDGKTCTVAGDCIGGTCTNGVCRSPLVGTLNVHSSWQTGFCGTLNLQNTHTTPTSNWSVQMNFEHSSFTSTDGAVFTPQGSGIYRLTPATWNRVIYPSSHTTVSFCANITGANWQPELIWVSPQY